MDHVELMSLLPPQTVSYFLLQHGTLEAGGQTDISHFSKTAAVAVFSPCYKCMGCFLSHRWEGKIGHGGSGGRSGIKGIITEANN